MSQGLAALALLAIGGAAPAGRLSKLRLKIEAGNAPFALTEFVRQSGMQVLFEFDAIRDRNTKAVSGQLDAAEALAIMLEGSGLTFEFVNDRTITVRPRSGAARSDFRSLSLR